MTKACPEPNPVNIGTKNVQPHKNGSKGTVMKCDIIQLCTNTAMFQRNT